MQQNGADFEVEVAELGGQSKWDQADSDVLGYLGGRQFVRTRTPVNYSHWNALAQRWMLGSKSNGDAGYGNRFPTVDVMFGLSGRLSMTSATGVRTSTPEHLMSSDPEHALNLFHA